MNRFWPCKKTIPLKGKLAVNHLKIEQLTFENCYPPKKKKHMPPWEMGTSSTQKCWLVGDMLVSWRVGSQMGAFWIDLVIWCHRPSADKSS